MNTSEFDDLLRSEFGQHEFAVNPDNWARMQQRLQDRKAAQGTPVPKARPVVARKWWWPASGIAAALVTLLVLNRPAQTLLQPEQGSPALATPATAGPQPMATAALPETKDVMPPAPPQETRPQAPRSAAIAAPQHVQAPIAAPQASPPEKAAPTPEHSALAAQEPSPAPVTRSRIDLSNGDNAWEEEPSSSPVRRKKTSLSVGGGLNYGSLNTGYAVAVNARTSLGRSFYIEGDLGVVNNTAGSSSAVTQKEYKAIQSGFTGDVGNLGPGESKKIERSNMQLYYLQFAPAVGYRISRKLSVGAGPDFQQLLRQQEDKTVVTNQDMTEVEVVPAFDFGLQGKTEYSISPRLQAGVQYREGLNNRLQKGDKYVNRRYLQVQLRYRLFGRP